MTVMSFEEISKADELSYSEIFDIFFNAPKEWHSDLCLNTDSSRLFFRHASKIWEFHSTDKGWMAMELYEVPL